MYGLEEAGGPGEGMTPGPTGQAGTEMPEAGIDVSMGSSISAPAPQFPSFEGTSISGTPYPPAAAVDTEPNQIDEYLLRQSCRIIFLLTQNSSIQGNQTV